MRDPRSPIDDTVVTLVFHGSIVALAVVSALGAEDRPPPPTSGISVVVASATVLYVSHVFAALVPRAARAGHLRREHLAAALQHDAPLLLSVIVPVVPLALAATGVVPVARGYQLSIRSTLAMLFVLALTLGRRDGLSWGRSLAAGGSIIVVATAVIVLESMVH
jgi:hypothetical protein